MIEILSFFISYFFSLVLLKYFISYQRNNKIGQPIRKEGPDLHSHKEGTPTGGGIIFIPVSLSVVFLVSLIFKRYETLIPLLAGSLFSIIGFFDDLKKIKGKKCRRHQRFQKVIISVFFCDNHSHTDTILQSSHLFNSSVHFV